MTAPSNVSRFVFQIPSLKEPLLVVGFQFYDRMDQPYECELELACESRDLKLDTLLGKAGVLTLFDEKHPRLVHGEVAEIAMGAVGKRLTSYYVTLRPKLWLLQLRGGLRIFQDKSAPDIIQQVLKEAGIEGKDVQVSLSKTYQKRHYCTQYRETDFQFISRLMQQEGIFYYFEHRLDGHTLVITDKHTGLGEIEGNTKVPFRSRSGMVAGAESVYQIESEQKIYSGAVASRDFNFEKPALKLETKKADSTWAALETYQFPGRYKESGLGKHYATAQLTGQLQEKQRAHLMADCPRLQVGRRFQLLEHPIASVNADYLITETRMEGRQPQALEEGAAGEGSSFSVRCVVMPASAHYYPQQIAAHPTVEGVQTAFVTGPKGEEIYTDEQGRVKVQFHWDREGKHNEHSSCWLRVGQAWAGNQWGALALPRIGQEVIVSFVNADPDQPLVSGSLYNAKTMPPYDLPANKTRSTLKTQTSPGGNGYNEIRIEDKKGAEQLFFHAQKDMELYAKNHLKRQVLNEFHQIVKHSVFTEIGEDQHCTVGKNRFVKIAKSVSQKVGKDYHQKSGVEYKITVGKNLNVKAGTSVMLDAGLSLTLKAGGGTIALGPSGVSIQGKKVRINSGGGGASAKSASPAKPQQPKQVEPGKPGSNIAAIGKQARFKYRPVEFDSAKLKKVDTQAAAKLDETFVHGAGGDGGRIVGVGEVGKGGAVGGGDVPDKRFTTVATKTENILNTFSSASTLHTRGYKPQSGERALTQAEYKELSSELRARVSLQGVEGHGHARHGVHTTLTQQETRIQTKIAPDGQKAPTSRATIFDSNQAELEAVRRAQAEFNAANSAAPYPTMITTPSGKVKPNTVLIVVSGRKNGYGSGVELIRDANGKPLPGRPIQPTGQDSSAKVIFRHNPSTGQWDIVTQYPTN